MSTWAPLKEIRHVFGEEKAKERHDVFVNCLQNPKGHHPIERGSTDSSWATPEGHLKQMEKHQEAELGCKRSLGK